MPRQNHLLIYTKNEKARRRPKIQSINPPWFSSSKYVVHKWKKVSGWDEGKEFLL